MELVPKGAHHATGQASIHRYTRGNGQREGQASPPRSSQQQQHKTGFRHMSQQVEDPTQETDPTNAEIPAVSPRAHMCTKPGVTGQASRKSTSSDVQNAMSRMVDWLDRLCHTFSEVDLCQGLTEIVTVCTRLVIYCWKRPVPPSATIISWTRWEQNKFRCVVVRTYFGAGLEQGAEGRVWQPL